MTNFTRKLVVLTIAAALKRVSVLKGKIKELNVRSMSTVSWSNAERAPDFKYQEVEGQLTLTKERLITLQSTIAIANATKMVELEGGVTMVLAEAIRRAEEQKDEIARLKVLPIREGDEAKAEDVYDDTTRNYRRVMTKVAWCAAVSNVERHRRIEALEQKLEALNNAITATNHLNKVEWQEPIAAAAE